MKQLSDTLSKSLPKDLIYRLLYVQSKPIYVKPLINSKKNGTIKIRHFFNLIDSSSVIILGIEILVYLVISPDKIDQYIFIAKCDTVGFTNQTVRVGPIVKALLQWLMKYNLSRYSLKKQKIIEEEKEDFIDEERSYNMESRATLKLIQLISSKLSDPNFFSTIPYYNPSITRSKPDKNANRLDIPSIQNIRICLFAKAAPQYLFPYSFKNKHKHVVNGSILLKWWLKVLDDGLDDPNWKCKLIIPGSDTASTKKFLTTLKKNWSVGHLFNTQEPAIFSVPLFPDDPKGRFLEHLVVEDRYQTIGDEQFFTELGIRQEFRLGDVVGLIGCEILDQDTKSSQDSYEFNVLTVREYKQLMALLKNENYSIGPDIKNLVDVKIPGFFEKNNLDDFYIEIKGNEVMQKNASLVAIPTINTLNVRRKKTKLNDLNNPVKRRPELDVPELDVPELDVPQLNVPELNVPQLDVLQLNDVNNLVKRKPELNDLNNLIKRKPKQNVLPN